jgi:hypothetical protein
MANEQAAIGRPAWGAINKVQVCMSSGASAYRELPLPGYLWVAGGYHRQRHGDGVQ